MLSEFQRSKFFHLFRRFYDSNKNGVITHSDFVQMIADLKKFRDWDDQRVAKCESTMEKAWAALKQNADLNQDHQVSLEEWFQYWNDFIEKSKATGGWPADEPWIKDYMSFWFDLLDTSGDGLIDEGEFLQVCKHFGMSDAECSEAFHKFGTRPVSRDYFADLWLQFMTSDNPADPGNYLFGPVSTS